MSIRVRGVNERMSQATWQDVMANDSASFGRVQFSEICLKVNKYDDERKR